MVCRTSCQRDHDRHRDHAAHTVPDQTWRAFPMAQQPQWPDPVALRLAVAQLAESPPLVMADECDLLRERLAAVARGEAFLLQGGDCAETFAGVRADQVNSKLRTLLMMSIVLSRAGSVPVVKTGRMAGQYAKPRTLATETRQGRTLPTYRGDAVNGLDFSRAARTPDARRLIRMYYASAATLHLMRAFTAWPLTEAECDDEVVRGFPAFGASDDRRDVAAVMADYWDTGAAEGGTEFFTCHEALLLDYEGALTRTDTRTDRAYGLSGHMLWVGERTRQLDGAHVEFASQVSNPVGVKLGPTVTADEALMLIDRLDPKREAGRLTFITRMGCDRVRDRLPELVEKVAASGAQVVWVCDPMHGNTFEAPSGHKTRRFDHIVDEITGFFEVHRALGSTPGGVHIELAGEHVTECVGGVDQLGLDDLPLRYESACDPRLNARQSMELASAIAELLRAGRGRADGDQSSAATCDGPRCGTNRPTRNRVVAPGHEPGLWSGTDE